MLGRRYGRQVSGNHRNRSIQNRSLWPYPKSVQQICQAGDVSDIITILLQTHQHHKIDTEWISSYTDLKKQYQKVKKLYEPKGLKHATESEGLEFEGTLHRAIDDAYNLTRIFTKYFGEWNLHKIN